MGFSKLRIRSFNDYDGFSLIEIMVVVAIIAILAAITVPSISNLFSSSSENMAIFTKTIRNAHDDAFLKNTSNYLIIHLNEPEIEDSEIEDDIFKRRNGISILKMKSGKFIENKRKIFRFREFPGSFKIEAIVKDSGEVVTNGYEIVPFYPQGYSKNVIIHILANNDRQWSVRVFKHFKEPEVIRGHVQFEELE